MKAYGGVDAKIHVFFTLALVEGEWWASRPCCFTPRERAAQYSLHRRLDESQIFSNYILEKEVRVHAGCQTYLDKNNALRCILELLLRWCIMWDLCEKISESGDIIFIMVASFVLTEVYSFYRLTEIRDNTVDTS
jgi:hypothetical protein